ncbi:MAG: YeeE/YedE family protein, partial [Cyanobacteria bacterium P01_H01_bin.15]
MAEFHWIPALTGGLLIGISATILLACNGRIAGISG